MTQLIATNITDFHKFTTPIITSALDWLERLEAKYAKKLLQPPTPILTTCNELFEWGSGYDTIEGRRSCWQTMLPHQIENATCHCNKEIERYRGKLYAAVIKQNHGDGKEGDDPTTWCVQRMKNSQRGPDWVRLPSRHGWQIAFGTIYLFRRHQDATAFKLTFG